MNALLSTLAGSLMIFYSKHRHGGLALDSATGIQRQHQQPNPRIGGLAIWIGLLRGAVACFDELCISV